MKYLLSSLMLIGLSLGTAMAQNLGPAVGEWRSMNCYYGATSAAASADRIYVGTTTALFVYDEEDEMVIPFSKVNGLSDAGIRKVAYDYGTGKLIIAYDNTNLDILENGKVFNIPDIMVSTLPGDKSIRHITAYAKEAYLSTPIGMIVVSLTKNEISYTTTFYTDSSKAEVFATLIFGDYLYAATSKGLLRILATDANKQDYTRWELVSDRVFHQLAQDGTHLYSLKNLKITDTEYADTVFKYTSGDFEFFYASNRKIAQLSPGLSPGVWIGEEYNGTAGRVAFFDAEGVLQRQFTAYFPGEVIERGDIVYFAENDLTRMNGGLRKGLGSGPATSGIAPDGPESPYAFDVWAYNGEIWIAHGGHDYNWAFTGHRKAFSSFRNNVWKTYADALNALGYEFLSDASVIYKDRRSGKVYVGMAMGGLVVVDKGDHIEVLREPYIEEYYPGAYVVSGIAADNKGQLWFNNFGATLDIRMLQPSGNWYSFHPSSSSSRLSHSILVDDYGYKWMGLTAGGGVVVFDDNGTYDYPGDDRSRVLRTGKGNGNLPSAVVLCLANDLDNNIWIGTNDGIGIVELIEDVIKGTADATIRIVAYNNEPAGPLFKGKSVTAIAVDGSNNKWIGTAGNGVWLISSDGSEVLKYFQAKKSPLPSDYINSIDIDPITGDVYFSTDKGVVIYRGDAIASYDKQGDNPLLVYPNPVPTGYTGSIAIKGLSGRCEVRITDIAGQLVAQWTTEGGQAVWNGLDYTGRRPQSGVYLITITDVATGKVLQSGKLIFNE